MLKRLPVNRYGEGMKILITGGFGFVGSKLLDILTNRYDLDITVIDNLLSGDNLNYKVHFIEGDIRNRNVMDKLIPQFDTIIHLAAIVGEPACIINPDFAYNINVQGTRNILSAMTKHQRIIFTSTSSVYGNRPNELVTEESIPLPINNYAQHKYISELDIQYSGKDYIILRPVTAFGITQRIRLDLLVNTLIYEGLSYGRIEVFEPSIMRPIIHVNDFARIIAGALFDILPYNQVYNIGDPFYTMTKLQLAKEIAMLTGATVIEKDGKSLDPRNYDVSFQKLMDTDFVFIGNRLSLAVSQIKSVQYTIAENPKSFSTPYRVEQFLLQEK
jgi:nucleoside-diphosphate-sugar epimerase